MFERLRRRRKPEITGDLALCLAAHVAAGLAANTRGDVIEEGGRARAALVAIGLMLGNATPDERVQATLALEGRVDVDVAPVA